MSVREAAEHAGVSGALIKRWLAEGRVRGLKSGRSWVVDEADLKRFLGTPRANGRPKKTTPAA